MTAHQSRGGAGAALAFVTCIERGFLEEQSLLLYQSIRRFGGRYCDAPIYACCPRVGRGVAAKTVAALEALAVNYIEEPLNRDLDYFAYANKNFAASFVERNSRHDTLVFLDSDTLFLREPQLLDLPKDVDVRVRPVDVKGICSSGPDDPFERYWRELASLCDTDLESLPSVHSTVDRLPIRASYNGGLVVARAGLGIFRRWEENILAVHRTQLRPQPESLWGTGQSTLAMAIHAATSRVELLPESYNYPLHLHQLLAATQQIAASLDVVHLHYHWMFERRAWPDCALAQPEFVWEPDVRDWLFARLPLIDERPSSEHGVPTTVV